MRVVLFGATGMVGQGVLRECLRDEGISAVLVVGRTPTGQSHPKLTEIVHSDLYDLSPVADRLAGYDACFFCLGVSSAGMGEAAYTRVTYELTMAVARVLAQADPGMRFVYVSGAGTDSTERGRSMWARVKGRTENALLAMPFDTYVFRPGFIQPMHGIVSKTGLYRVGYAVTGPLYPLLRRLFPSVITTTEKVGLAMVRVGHDGARERILGNREINAVAA
ncbi:NAD(P)H-binding protein [Catellatospora tritici]|uniref:NAD(P)H-binding protein n=1 Tax=Catellatospora tritici TaxID=2851566 RepID=UPI001C2D4268|nr:NAD(P)H-binding protein [Catellatospora tritici]MBV1855469.1 NAD(P)H-binding protein [Catellatospora tritici]